MLTAKIPPHIPEIHTQEVDEYRRPADTDELRKKMRKTVSSIEQINALSGLEESIGKYFSGNKFKGLPEFFYKHPHVYKDLIRKTHKHREYRDGKWSIPDKKMKDIATLFLVRGRDDCIGTKVHLYLKMIQENSKFIEYCSDQPSILDYSGYQFSRIPVNKRKHDIENLIKGGLIQNIKGCHDNNIDTYFSESSKLIISYVEKIFGIYTQDLLYCQTLPALAKKINELLSQGGNERKKGWKIVQAFHAWGNVVEIEKVYHEAIGKAEKMRDKFKNIGVHIETIGTNTTSDGVKVFTSQTLVLGKKVTLSWRVKTPKSILQKMWETEEYTNVDAVRDLIGLSVTYPDDISENEKEQIMLLFGKMMPHYGYILKNKGELSHSTGESLDRFAEELKKQKNSPIYTSDELGDSTDPRLRNASMSGFSQVGGMNVGFEIQFSTESAMEWKKQDDLKYKPRSAILALMRGPKESTPQEIYNLLNKRLRPGDLTRLGYNTINEFILDLIDGEYKFLIPYMSKDQRVILLTTPKYEEKFLELWNDDKLVKQTASHEGIVRYIRSLTGKF